MKDSERAHAISRNTGKTMKTSTFIAALIIIVAATVAANQAFAKPLGGWDTFPGPVAEPTGCKPTRKTRCV